MHRNTNRNKITARAVAWQKANPDKARASYAKYRASNREKRSAFYAEWADANCEKRKAYNAAYYSANRNKILSRASDYYMANPEKSRIKCHTRRARKRESGGELSRGLVENLFKLQRGKCACCGKPLGADYQRDHIMPLALGGQNIDSNIQLLRAKCNMEKHAKHPEDFMRQRGFLL